MSPDGPRTRDATVLFVLALVGLTLALHAELLGRFSSAVPHDLGDPLLNTWILWWNAHHVPFTASYWNAPSFAPAPFALALSETLLGLTWLTSPLQWLGASPLVAYNVAFVATPILNGLAAYWLCLTLTGRADAAAVGGFAFAFAPYHASELPHLQTRALFWMPIALVGLHRYWNTGRRRWLLCLVAGMVGNALTCGYFFLYFAVMLGIAVVWLTVAPGTRTRVLPVLGACAVATTALLPVIVPYRMVKRLWSLGRPMWEVESFGADLTTIVTAADPLILWPIHPRDWQYPGALFPLYPGVAITLLLLVAAAIGRGGARPAPPAAWRRAAVLGLAGGAAVAFGAALAAWWWGPWAIGEGRWRLSVAQLRKPVSVGLDLVLAAILVSPRFAALARSGSTAGLYATGAVVSMCCALGPAARVLGHPFWYKPPFAWLLELPGFDSIRVPALFTAMSVVCVSVLAALSVVRLFAAPTRRAAAAAAVMAAAIVLDGWGRVGVVAAPRPLPVPVTGDLVVELPRRGLIEDVAAMYRGIAHRHPVVNGYSGYAPPHYAALTFDLAARCYESLDTVRGGRSLDIVIWRDADVSREIDEGVGMQWGTSTREEMPDAVVYRIPRAADRGEPPPVDAAIDLSTACAAARSR